MLLESLVTIREVLYEALRIREGLNSNPACCEPVKGDARINPRMWTPLALI